MKVHDSNLSSVTIGTNSSARTEALKGGRTGASSNSDINGQDRISISDLGSMLRSVSGESAGRTERVNQLAALYRSGGYSPDLASVSRSIVHDAVLVF